ncbi:MAG: hypothetical protein B7Z73_04585 [Planctomycetia bacterium 21-64-5]|nr:MAG: hypothetical protein B7Z73_04585 [Planctomycetia bacterium 21-64-5]HQU41735.1 helix-turn-helix domain-containing protein [Pirellulales bacterium]
MPASRASVNALGKLLSAAAEPFYVVAADRRIVFLNDACTSWLGTEANELVGQQCQYSTAAEGPAASALAAALCPPPEAFAGRRTTAQVVLPGTSPGGAWEIEFVPLKASDGAWLVLALVHSGGAAVDEEAGTSATRLHARLQQYRRKLALRYHVDRLLGDSPDMQRARAQAKLAAGSSASVSIVGPPGSHREHLARAIHYGGSGAAGPLVPLASALLDADLLQAALRSLARGKSGEQRPATLLLGDIDALPEAAQTDLSRSLSGGRFAARIISTSRSPLGELAVRGVFRADLACLLSTISIELPSLGARLADLPLLVQWYVEQANLRTGKQVGGCLPEVHDRLAGHAWTNDLQELEEVIDEAHLHAQGPLIGLQDLPPRLALAAQASTRPAKSDEKIVLEEYLAKVEHELIVRALKRAKGNKTKAARLLGMTRPRLYRRLVQLGLDT